MQDQKQTNHKGPVPYQDLPPIPNRRYFTIGEVARLCAVKPYVLRYWEQEFPQLRPSKRRGNRRYYQYKDVEVVRRIYQLLYSQGFTISGARQHLKENSIAISAPVAVEPMETLSVQQDSVIMSQPSSPIISELIRDLEDILKDLQAISS